MTDETKVTERIERFEPGKHPEYPEGCVIKTLIGPAPDREVTVEVFTLAQWDGLE